MPEIGNTAYISYASEIGAIQDTGNPSFARASLLVCYTGRNRNGSYISRETIEQAMPTIYNCPVVCNYDIDTDTIGGHDVKYVADDNGTVAMMNLTDGVGVVPESAKWDFVMRRDGEIDHEYLRVDILLYKRSAVYQKIARDGVCAESMEINIGTGHEREDGSYSIDSFNFEAFCLLGEGVTPCFESAGIRLYAHDEFAAKLHQMMEDYKAEFAQVNASTDEDDINTTEGGKCRMDITEILAKFNLTVEQIDFDYSGMSAEEIESEIQKRVDEGKFGLTGAQLVEGLYTALEGIETVTMHDYWDDCDYEMPRYGYVDYDMSSNTVIAYDRKDDWNLYGFSYSLNGDSVVIDADSRKRKRVDYVDFDEGNAGTVGFNLKEIVATEVKPAISAFDSCVRNKFDAERSELNEKISTYSAEAERLGKEVSELTEYKNGIIAEQRRAAVEEIFSQFADLNGNEAFEALRENYGDMETEQIEEKCFAIRGRAGTKFALNEQSKAPKLPVGDYKEDDREKPYGGLVEKYKNRNSK